MNSRFENNKKNSALMCITQVHVHQKQKQMERHLIEAFFTEISEAYLLAAFFSAGSGGSLDKTHIGAELSHKTSPSPLCLKSG